MRNIFFFPNVLINNFGNNSNQLKEHLKIGYLDVASTLCKAWLTKKSYQLVGLGTQAEIDLKFFCNNARTAEQKFDSGTDMNTAPFQTDDFNR